MPTEADPTAPQTTDGDDVAEAFMRLCEALGIPATAGAYLEVPRILKEVEERGYDRGHEAGTYAGMGENG